MAQGRDVVKGRRLEAELDVRFLAADVRELSPATSGLDKADFVFHAAGVTSSARMVARPEEVLTTAVDGTRNVLDLAVALGARGVVCVSSMEVYGQGLSGVVAESDLGTVDPHDPRSSYPEGKRRAEALSAAYATKYGLRTTNARLGLTFGAGVPNDPDNTRVPLQFARSVLAGRDIELHTDGAGLTNVCYLADAVRALLLLATKGAAGEAYNVANPQASMTHSADGGGGRPRGRRRDDQRCRQDARGHRKPGICAALFIPSGHRQDPRARLGAALRDGGDVPGG